MPGYADDKDQILPRLWRIEGQVRGLQRLVDQDTYYIDVLTQIGAVDKALKGVAVNQLDGHLRHCVRDGMAAGGRDAEPTVTEATDAIARLVRGLTRCGSQGPREEERHGHQPPRHLRHPRRRPQRPRRPRG
jgi:CsoR family transcriptional regulator, copper-sensing transcriptional repressor